MRRSSSITRAILLALAVLFCAAAGAAGLDAEDTVAPSLDRELNESVIRIPVTVRTAEGRDREGRIVVTLYRPAGAGPFPLMVVNHGRDARRRADPPRVRALGLASYGVRRGFAVAVPTRLGYGESGLDPDPEVIGPCDRPDYRPMMTAAARQIDATIRHLRGYEWIDARRVVIAGESVGGLAALAYSAHAGPETVGIINFAGGAGGDARSRPGRPCRPAALSEALATVARPAGPPTLWLYAENDMYWGPTNPRAWADAYQRAGGTRELHVFPPLGEDGHTLAARGRNFWRPVTDAFLARLGFVQPRDPKGKPPRLASAADVTHLASGPADSIANGYRAFLALDFPRAFATDGQGSWGYQSGINAMARAIARCAETARGTCRLYAVDDLVVAPD